jgi:hypothetical protein
MLLSDGLMYMCTCSNTNDDGYDNDDNDEVLYYTFTYSLKTQPECVSVGSSS